MSFWKKWNSDVDDTASRCGKRQFPTWIAGVLIGVCLLAVGAFNDQLVDIYRKAIMICLECIGIG